MSELAIVGVASVATSRYDLFKSRQQCLINRRVATEVERPLQIATRGEA